MNPAPCPPLVKRRKGLFDEKTRRSYLCETLVLMGLDVVDAKDKPVPLDASTEVVVKADISPLHLGSTTI